MMCTIVSIVALSIQNDSKKGSEATMNYSIHSDQYLSLFQAAKAAYMESGVKSFANCAILTQDCCALAHARLGTALSGALTETPESLISDTSPEHKTAFAVVLDCIRKRNFADSDTVQRI